MGSGYFLIFLIVIISIGLNVYLLTKRKSLKLKIENQKRSIKIFHEKIEYYEKELEKYQ